MPRCQLAHHQETFRLEVADRLHSAAIHLLRHARKQDVFARQGPARLSALSVLVFGGPMALGQLAAAEQVKAPTMSRIVAGLKRSGLAKGKRVLHQARARRVRLVADTLRWLSEPEMETLLRAADLMERAVRRTGKKN